VGGGSRWKGEAGELNAETLSAQRGDELADGGSVWLDCPSGLPSRLPWELGVNRADMVNEESIGQGSMDFYYCQ
jgi:hypothetical protein